MGKWAARRAAQRAISVVVCFRCGAKQRLQRHHEDLAKPLEVIVLCQKCHVSAHMKTGTWGGRIRLPRLCPICKTWFLPNHSTNKTCASKNCLRELGRKAAARLWKGQSKERECVVCHKKFQYQRAREKTCSRFCGAKLAWRARVTG